MIHSFDGKHQSLTSAMTTSRKNLTKPKRMKLPTSKKKISTKIVLTFCAHVAWLGVQRLILQSKRIPYLQLQFWTPTSWKLAGYEKRRWFSLVKLDIPVEPGCTPELVVEHSLLVGRLRRLGQSLAALCRSFLSLPFSCIFSFNS